MGRLKNGINGPFTGKIGTVVGVNWRGIDYVRSAARKGNKKPSPAQIKQRSGMSLISAWLKSVKDLILIGFQRVEIGKTEMNLAMSYNMKEALIEVNDVPEIDYPSAIFSRGELLVSYIIELKPLVGGLNIKWANGSQAGLNKNNDKATFLVYNPVKGSFVTFQDVARRDDQQVTLSLPATFKNDKIYCYMQYVNETGNEVSTTLYVGEVSLL